MARRAWEASEGGLDDIQGSGLASEPVCKLRFDLIAREIRDLEIQPARPRPLGCLIHSSFTPHPPRTSDRVVPQVQARQPRVVLEHKGATQSGSRPQTRFRCVSS